MRTKVANERKIFGIGLSRTGTSSLTLALEYLGFKAVHFPCDETTQRELLAFVSSPKEELWLSILDKYDALTDTPVCCAYKALDKAYSHSRFILTIREKQSWLESCRTLWARRRHRMVTGIPDVPFRQFITFVNETVYSTDEFDERIFSSVYDNHAAEVMRHFRDRPRDLLIFDICSGESWDKLSDFLDIKRTILCPFPHQQYPEFRSPA
jgi:Sulfotransferase domain